MTMLICPHCGTANRPDANFCNTCGTDLSELLSPRAENGKQPGGEEPSPSDRPHPVEPDAVPPVDHETPPQTHDQTGREAGPPLFDLGLASPDGGKETSLSTDAPPPVSPLGLEQLLPPTDPFDDAELWAQSTPQPRVPVDRQTGSWMQQILGGESPVLAAAGASDLRRPDLWYESPLRQRWIFLLILAAVLLPGIVNREMPAGSPHGWSGVAQAHTAIEALPAGADVLLFWAYDPATAGEMDLVVEPLLAHLVLREANMTFISPMPLGPATVRRQMQATLDEAEITGDPARAAQRLAAYNIFLPGGAAVLPLVARSSVTPLDGGRHGAALLDEMARPRYAAPALAVVVAADAEDVQHWLEMVQPRNRVPTIAVTAAGADPVVRPYLDSNQLTGLVSGFDGAYQYRTRMDRRLSAAETETQRTQIAVQNWGLLAVLLLLVAGNLIGLLFRGGNDRA